MLGNQWSILLMWIQDIAACVSLCSSIIIVLTFGILCYIRIKNIVVTTVNSLKMRSLQRQLFFALVIQTLVPFLLMHIPVALMFAFVFLDIDLGVYSAIVSMTIAIYPAVDPIPTLVIVENYRKTIIYWLCCCKKVAHVPGQTTIEPTRFATLPPSNLELDLEN
ncbi:hypothetical protein L5515_007017 [Caenorhabditis briggsae]|uniref:Uncharacterized protein n=1 Tax=Caenorhabditis briggsae TaxID=6238 RepID=A0AAE9F3E8_CAEBR|nr:hypothetical protein L5515_007017 [Caenorhabditis briggsae]